MSWKHPARNTCPECGEGPLCRDATVYWHAGRGEWTLSDSASDFIFCGACAAEFKDGDELLQARKLVIYHDTDCQNPREEEVPYGTMACFHRRYELGDKGHGLNADHFEGWDEIREFILTELKAIICLPLYLYDHSGLTISTKPFSCGWDSGQVGFIYVTPAQAKEYGIEPSAEGLENLLNGLLGAVEAYDGYLRGECFGFRVMKRVHGKDDEWEEEESCWGFLGEKWAKEGIAEHSGFSRADVEKAFNNIQYS